MSNSWLQALMRERKWLSKSSLKSPLGEKPIIIPKEVRAPTCDVSNLLCSSCLSAKAKSRSPDISKTTKRSNKDMLLKQDHCTPGACVSIDHYASSAPGRLLHTFGRESSSDSYHGGSIFVDHASCLIYHHGQVSLRAGETIKVKQKFEEMAKSHVIIVQSYRPDNGVFASQEFKNNVSS